MKLLIIGDLHGQIPQQLITTDFDRILFVGDACSNKYFSLIMKSLRERKKTGKYISWIDRVGKVKAKRMIKESLKDGRKVFEWLNSLGKPVYFVPGNWDFAEYKYQKVESDWNFLNQDFFTPLTAGLHNVHNIFLKKKSLKEVELIGFGLTSGPEDDLDEWNDKSFTQLCKLFEKAKKPVIYLSHNVPYNTKVDKVVNPKSPVDTEHMGSTISRELIEEFHPVLAVAGHMHEHYGKTRIKKTKVLNAGFGKHAQTLVEIKDGKISSIKLNPKCKPFKY